MTIVDVIFQNLTQKQQRNTRKKIAKDLENGYLLPYEQQLYKKVLRQSDFYDYKCHKEN